MVLLPNGRQREFLFAIGAGAISNVSLNLLLIPRLNHAGAALAMFLTEAIVACVMYLLSLKIAKVTFMGSLLWPLGAGFLAGTAVFILDFSSLFSRGLVSLLAEIALIAIIYLLLLRITGHLKIPILIRSRKTALNLEKKVPYLFKHRE